MTPRSASGSSYVSGTYSLSSIDQRPVGAEKRTSSDTMNSSRSSDESEYDSREPILHTPSVAPKQVRSFNSVRYQIPNRVVRYICLGFMGSILLFMLVLVRASMNSQKLVSQWGKDNPPPPPTWESFPFLQRYYGGVRSIVAKPVNIQEYPHSTEGETQPEINSDTMHAVPKSQAYVPYPDYSDPEYVAEYGQVNECFLDAGETIKVPRMHAYTGVPSGFPEPAYGSYELLGLNNSQCFDRFGKYGPYGYGYSLERGGVNTGLDGEREGADEVWKGQEQVDFYDIKWGAAQKRCAKKNAHRFKENKPRPESDPIRAIHFPQQGENAYYQANNKSSSDSGDSSRLHKIPRQAILLRTWSDFDYTIEQILYLRSLISEASLASGGEYDVHFLIHVKDNDSPIWADDETYERVLKGSLPPEFEGMGTLWNERQMELLYSGVTSTHRIDLPVLGVYRAAHLPVQYFAHMHPEYDFFWNWEMDIRYSGNFYELFSHVGKWAQAQPRKGMWERNHRFYIPQVHGPWEDFRQTVRVQSEDRTSDEPSSKWANMGPDGKPVEQEPIDDRLVWGPMWAEGDEAARPFDDMPKPPLSREKDTYQWGVGEDADLILFQPIFDPVRTSWWLQDDFSGYNMGDDGTKGKKPPRRLAIVAAGRMSYRLLDAMHREVALRRHSVFTEMMAPTMALHHGLKAVYAPHPVYVDRDWPAKYMARTFNPGPKGVSGRHKQSVFGDCCQHNLRGVTWHYNAEFGQNLWKRWWGLKVNGDGGEQAEMDGEGRMCIPAMLFHPIKNIELPVEKPPEAAMEPDEQV